MIQSTAPKQSARSERFLPFTFATLFFAVIALSSQAWAGPPPVDEKTVVEGSPDGLPWGATFGLGAADDEFRGSFEAPVPLYYNGRSFVFLYPEITAPDNGFETYSIGLGYRILLDQPEMILGVNIFYDYTETDYDNAINQFGAGLELLTHRFDARINYQLPEGDRFLINERSDSSTQVSSNVVGRSSSTSDPFMTGAGVFQKTTTTQTVKTTRTTTTRFFEQYESGMEGVDMEGGVLLPWLDRYADVRLFGGYYHYDNPFGGDVNGLKARLEARINEYLTVDAAYYEDKELTGSNWYAGIRVTIPIGRARSSSDRPPVHIPSGSRRFFSDRLAENIIRDPRVKTSVSGFMENVGRREVESESSTSTRMSMSTVRLSVPESDIIFVNGENPQQGDGSFDNPFQTIGEAQAEAELRFSDSGLEQTIYVFFDDYDEAVVFGGPVASPLLAAPLAVSALNGNGLQVRLLDSSNPLVFDGMMLGGDPLANHTAPLGTIPLSIYGADRFTLGGFNITSQDATALKVENVNQLVIQDTQLNSTGGTALHLDAVRRVVGNNIRVITNGGDTGISIVNSGGANPSTLNFQSTDISNKALAGFLLQNNTGAFSFGNINVNGGGGAGIDVNGGSATFTFDDIDIENVGGSGIAATNFNGTFNAIGTTTITNPGDAGIDILGGTGTFTFSDTMITDSSGTAFNVDGGSANVTYSGGSINQGNNATAVNVQGGHTGTLNFGIDINATNGDGLQFDNADGVYDFQGQITLNGGDAGIDILNGSGGTFTFGGATSINITAGGIGVNIDSPATSVAFTGGLDIDTTSGIGFNATGGATVSVTGSNSITTTTATALNLNGITTGTGGINFDTIAVTTGGVVGVDGIHVENVTTSIGKGINIGSAALTGIRADAVDLNTITGAGGFTLTSANIVQGAAGDGVTIIGNNTGSTINIGNGTSNGVSGLNIDGGNRGIVITSVSAGNINIASTAAAGSTLQIGTTTPLAGGDGIFVSTFSSAGTLNIGNATTKSSVIAGANSALVIQSTGAASTVNVNNMALAVAGAGAGDTVEITNNDGAITLTSLDINGSGSSAADHGIQISDTNATGSVTINGTTTIDNVGGDGINSNNASFSASGITFGASATGAADDITGSGVKIINDDGLARTVTLNNLVITSNGVGITSVDGDNAGELTLRMNGNTIDTGTTVLAMDINGGASANGSTVVEQFNSLTVNQDGTGGGVRFSQVTFDAGGGSQVAGGTANIGSGAANRVQGDGLSFLNPTGDIGFTTLNIFNNAGTGLEVDTKGLGTTFNLATGGGTIDTTGGPAMFLDPLTGNLTFTTISSTNSTVLGGGATSAQASSNGTGITVDGLTSGSLTVTGNTTVSGSASTGINITNSGATFTFARIDIENTGADGVRLGNNSGTFTANAGTVNNSGGDAFEITNLLAGGQVTYGGSISQSTGELIYIDTTAAGSTINFNNTGANSIMGTGGGAILIVSADGNVTVTTPTTITNPLTSFLQTGISIFFGSGNISFTDTTIDLNSKFYNTGVEVNTHTGTIGFENLDISTNFAGIVGLSVFRANVLNVTGNNTITTNGGPAISLSDVTMIGMTFDSLSVTNSQDGFSGGSGVTFDDIGGGTFMVTGTTTVNGANGVAGIGIRINESSGTFTFADVDIDGTTLHGISVGSVSGNPGTVNINGGSVANTGADGVQLINVGGFNLNNTDFSSIGGFTTDITGSTVSGMGNTAVPFSSFNGGGNTGTILFNGGANSAP